MAKAQFFSAPSSGQLLGFIVKAFRLNDREIGGPVGRELNATLQKTAQRFFRGERIDHETSDMLCRQFAKALFHSRLFGEFGGRVESEDGPIGWETVFERAVIRCARAWDHEFWQSAAMFPRADKRLATLIVARQVVIELALRHASLVLMNKFDAPKGDDPWWATERGFGSFLRQIKETCSDSPSGSTVAKALGVDERTVDRWFGGEELPNLVHTDALARLFATQIAAADENKLILAFRRAIGVATLVAELRHVVGQRSILELASAHVCFVRWTIEMAESEAATDPIAHALFAAILVLGTAHPSNGPVLINWADRMQRFPWSDDIYKSHPVDRSSRVKESFRIVGDAETRQADLESVMPNEPPEVREALSEIAAWRAISTPSFSPIQLAKIQSGEQKVYRIPARSPAHAAENRMLQATQAGANDDFKTACVHAARAVHLQPERADYRFFYGAYLSQSHQWSEAREQLDIACKLKPEWDRPYVEIAIAYANQGIADSAIYHLESGPKAMRDSSAWYQLVLGKLYWKGRDFERALPCLEAAIVLDPKGGEAFDLAADSAFWLGNRALGAKYAKEAKHRGVFTTFRKWQDGEYPNAR